MNTTVRMKASQIYKDWHVIDAAGRPLGRVATEVATLLRGKHKPTYDPHLDDGDFVIVINASQVRLSGRKAETRVYYRHSGYPGGLKARSFEDQLARFPDRVIEQAVWGMLPGGSLGKKMMRHLKVYAGATHPHQSQITASEKAQEARKEAAAEVAAYKPKHLRPLSVAQVVEVAAPSAKAAEAARAARARVRKPAAKAAKPAAAEVETPVAEAAPVAEAPAPAEEKAPRRRTKAAAETETTTKATKATKAEAPAEAEAPKRPRKAAATETKKAPAAKAAEEPKKPTRRRSTAKTESSEE